MSWSVRGVAVVALPRTPPSSPELNGLLEALLPSRVQKINPSLFRSVIPNVNLELGLSKNSSPRDDERLYWGQNTENQVKI